MILGTTTVKRANDNKYQSVEHELETFEYERQNASGPN